MVEFLRVESDPETQEVRDIYDEMTRMGFGTSVGPINFFKYMGIRPDMLKVNWELTKCMLLEGMLPQTMKQLITMAVSKLNDAPYCCSTHTAALVALGVPEEIIESCATDPALRAVPSPTREILLFARKAAEAPKTLIKEDYQAMRDLGLADEEILEVVLLAAFANWTNTWADAAKIPQD